MISARRLTWQPGSGIWKTAASLRSKLPCQPQAPESERCRHCATVISGKSTCEATKRRNFWEFSLLIFLSLFLCIITIYPKKIFFINRKLGFYRRHKWTLSIKKATVEQRSNKILKLVENAYAITKSKSLLKHIDILEDKIKYCNTPFYRWKVLFYTLIKHPDIFLYIIRNLITFPIRKIYWYFLYEF